jgi:predicted small lipoprotein YifL
MIAKQLTTIAFLCAVLAVTAGCGRKAALDTPYEAAIAARKQAKEDKKPLPPAPKKPVTDRHFILDPLIE